MKLYGGIYRMKYEIIIFDADDTLFDFKKSEREAFKNTMLEFNINYDENYHLKIYQDINNLIWKEFEQGLITQEILKIERFKRLADTLRIYFNEKEFAKSYMKNLSNASFLLDGSADLIKSLSENYKLFIITNGLTFVQENRIRRSIIAKYFENIIISEEISISKPNPKIFEYTFKNFPHIDKNKLLMIGDSLTSDIQGGLNFGIDTCWFNPNKLINKTDINPTYEVSNFTALRNLLLK